MITSTAFILSPSHAHFFQNLKSEMAATKHIAFIPYPGRGHINPMLNLARTLSSGYRNNKENVKSMIISVIVTEEWESMLSSERLPSNVRLVSIPNVIPSENGRSADFVGFLDAVYEKMGPAVEELLGKKMEVKVEGIVVDVYVKWCVEVGRRIGVDVCLFFPMAASFFWKIWEEENVGDLTEDLAMKGGYDPLGREKFTLNSIGKSSGSHSNSTTQDIRKRALAAFAKTKGANCILFTSFYELEPQAIHSLCKYFQFPVYTVGPSIPYITLNDPPNDTNTIRWLDSQPKQSVLYVSLGSFLSVSGPQMDQILLGLKRSKARCLFVARGESTGKVKQVLGEDEDVMVVNWCDQLKVLNHGSIGGFMTHCGWNSILESVYCGVPMLTFPIFADQPLNSKLIVDEWKVGLSLKRADVVDDDDMVRWDEVASIVSRFMDLDGGESKEMRRRAMELKSLARGAVVPGGSSFQNLESFVGEILFP